MHIPHCTVEHKSAQVQRLNTTFCSDSLQSQDSELSTAVSYFTWLPEVAGSMIIQLIARRLLSCSLFKAFCKCGAGVGRTGWHIDGSFMAKPFAYSTYHIVNCPKQAGSPLFLFLLLHLGGCCGLHLGALHIAPVHFRVGSASLPAKNWALNCVHVVLKYLATPSQAA